MKISVIIPTHNRADALQKTLSHLRLQVFDHPWEAIVVNNNCNDNTDEVVREQAKSFPVPLRLLSEKKPGAAAARNTGAFNAKGEYLVFIDNDILTSPDFLERHLSDLNKYKGAWIVGYTENLPEQQNTPFGKCLRSMTAPKQSGVIPSTSLTGANTSMPREDFNRLGGFDENFHVASGEDRELAIRAIKAGIKLYFDPEISVLHNDWAGTSIRDYCKRQQLYTQTEPFFWKKYGDEMPRMQLVRENLPPSLRQDGFRLFCWKNMKRILGSSIGQSVLITSCEKFEKIFPKKIILWKLYRLAIAGAIYKGFNEGLKKFSPK